MKYKKFVPLVALLFMVVSMAEGLVLRKSLEELTDEATYIVKGKVVEKVSFWNESHSRIYTRVKVSVNEYIKGSGSGVVEFIVPGGTVNDTTLWVSDAPSWNVGEEVILFVNPSYYYPIVGWFQGKYKVVGNMAINEVDPERTMPIAELLKRVQQRLKE
jgi:hypothetical protein